MLAYDTVRHTAIVDRKANEYKIMTGGQVVGTVRRPDHAGMVVGENVRRLSFFGCFANDHMNSISNAACVRIFGVKVYDDDVLVHDYAPCLKGTEIGFYDRTTKAFFGRACGKVLTYGGDILTIEDDPYVASPNSLVTVTTGYTVTSNTCLEADVSIDRMANQQFIFEAGASGSPAVRLYTSKSTNQLRWQYGGATKQVGSPDPINGLLGLRRTFRIDAYHNTSTLATYGLTNDCHAFDSYLKTTSGDYPLRLFSPSGGDYVNETDARGFATIKLYGFKIYEKDVLRHDYEPMSWKGVGVLRDRVTGRVIYANVNTTATNTLVCGGSIRQLPYIESTGGQQIVLDYKTNPKSRLEVGICNLDRTNGRTLFGSTETNSVFAWLNAAGGGNPEMKMHDVWSGRLYTWTDDDDVRTYVADVSTDCIYNYLGGLVTMYKSKAVISMAAKSGYVHDLGESSVPIAVLGTNPVSDGCPGAAFRLTHMTVMEDGEVLHLYEPYIRNGIVGLKDAKTGKFFSGLNAGDSTAILYGGDIPYEGTPDAYVESDGTQFVPTGYLFNENARLEIDFQLMSPATDVAVAGSWNVANASPVGFHRTDAGEFSFVTPSADNAACVHSSTGLKADLSRCQAVIDRPAGVSQMLDGTTVKRQLTVAAFSGTASVPIGLFGNAGASGGSSQRSAVRIYSFRIREKAGDAYVLRHEYLPYANGETVGFRDTVTGNVIVNAEETANPLVIGGVGVEGSGSVFKVAPADDTVPVGKTATLDAFAPGAVRFRWTKDGEVLADETGATLDVAWVKRPYESLYTVTPIYDVYGRDVEGASVSATIQNARVGHVIFVR